MKAATATAPPDSAAPPGSASAAPGSSQVPRQPEVGTASAKAPGGCDIDRGTGRPPKATPEPIGKAPGTTATGKSAAQTLAPVPVKTEPKTSGPGGGTGTSSASISAASTKPPGGGVSAVKTEAPSSPPKQSGTEAQPPRKRSREDVADTDSVQLSGKQARDILVCLGKAKKITRSAARVATATANSFQDEADRIAAVQRNIKDALNLD